MHVLITGVAGFIGFHVASSLLAKGISVTGIDNLDPFYDVHLKEDRLQKLRLAENNGNFAFHKLDITDSKALHGLFASIHPSHVINLAAQASVRYSLVNPAKYIQANIVGFANLLEECHKAGIKHLLYASSSSVYGLNENWPYSPHQNVDHPASVYAATKKSGEALAHAYSHLWRMPTTGLRFFTVYGPWGRPDMATHLFTEAILQEKPIKLFNNGDLQRDFTYIDDIVSGMMGVLRNPPKANPDFDPLDPDPASSSAPWQIYNIGNNHTVRLLDFVHTLEEAIGKKAIIEYLPMQQGDMKSTLADISDLARDTGFNSSTSLREGLDKYVAWHKNYYGKK